MADRQATRRARRMLDQRLESVALAPLPATPKSGWLRAIRTAIGMSLQDLGERLQVSAQAVFQLEASERAGTIGIDSLRRAADALHCDVAYVLIPREGSLEATVRGQAERVLWRRQASVDRTMSLENQRAELSPEVREDFINMLMDQGNLWRQD